MSQRSRQTVGDDSLEKWRYMDKGGFGLVFKVGHKDLNKDVVVKLLDTEDRSLYAALCREADYMEAADQQFVPKVYGMYRGCPPGLGKEMQGIVMELMEGGSLKSFLKTKCQSKPPPWPLAFRLAHQVALAMDFLHSKKNLVHMDLKPANILLDANFNAKIADFGLSIVTNSVMSTKGENRGWTLSFAPPEAFEKDYHRVRSYDVYSYGILLWTILTGKNPYPGVDQLKLHVRGGGRPDLRKIDVQKASGLEDLVELMQRCWDSEPNKRPKFEECVAVTGGVLSRHEDGISAACDLLKPRPAPGSTDRKAFLKHSSPLSLDPNTASRALILSENNRRVTWTAVDQHYPDHPHRFTIYPQVLSNEPLSDPHYFEIEWRGGYVIIAVSQDDISREDRFLSGFGYTNSSWVLYYNDSIKRYQFCHNDIETKVSGPVPSPDGVHRWGVYVDPPAGVLCFYDVRGDTMSLLHTERTRFTQPLYAGICVYKATAQICKIW